LADAGGEHGRIGDLQRPVVGPQGDVAEAHLDDPGFEDPAQGAGPDPHVVTDTEGPGHKQHEPGEDIAQALLGSDPEHDAGQPGAHQ
jgi:hypothetical protein